MTLTVDRTCVCASVCVLYVSDLCVCVCVTLSPVRATEGRGAGDGPDQPGHEAG